MTDDIQRALAFDGVPAPEPDEAEALRQSRLECLRIEVAKRDDQFLVDGGDYGYGGEYVTYKELNEYAIAEWVDSLLERQKQIILEAVEEALTSP